MKKRHIAMLSLGALMACTLGLGVFYRLRRGRRGRGQAERIPRRHQLLLRRRERRAPAGVVRLRKQRCVEGGGRRLGRRLHRHQARFQQEYGKQQLQRADRWGILRFQVSQYHHARRSARVGPGDRGTSFRRQSIPQKDHLNVLGSDLYSMCRRTSIRRTPSSSLP